MAVKNPDKRVQRTRQALADALIALMVEKGYDDVTVQDILDRAGIGRSTFYAHFRDKEALFSSSLDGLRSGMLSHWKALLQSKMTSPGALGFALPFLRHVDGQRRLYRAITRGESGVILDRQIRRMFNDMVRADMAANANGRWSGPPLEAAVQFVVGALMSLFTWWMDSKIDLSAEELNRIFVDIALNGLQTDHDAME